MLEKLCPPAYVYVIFSIIHVIIDLSNQNFESATIKIILSIFYTLILQYLCSVGLDILSWIIVFIPFVLMSTVVIILMIAFGFGDKVNEIRNKQYNMVEQQNMNYDVRYRENKKIQELNETSINNESELLNNDYDKKILKNEKEIKSLEEKLIHLKDELKKNE